MSPLPQLSFRLRLKTLLECPIGGWSCCRSRGVVPFPAYQGLAVLQRRQALGRVTSVAALRRGGGPKIAASYLNRRLFPGAIRQSRERISYGVPLFEEISTGAVVSTTCRSTICVLTTCMYTCFTEENGPKYTCFTEENGVGVYLFHRGKLGQIKGVCGKPQDGSPPLKKRLQEVSSLTLVVLPKESRELKARGSARPWPSHSSDPAKLI